MALIQVNYLSKALMRTVPVNVVLPVDKLSYETFSYEFKNGQKFKTLYLLHGIFGNYTDWVSGTRIQRWAEEKNLAVVMPSGDNAFYVNGPVPTNNYEEFVAEELVEVTRNMFPLSDKKEDTFIAGLSMGGYGALHTGLKYPDTFGYVASLSGAVSTLWSKESLLNINVVFGDYEKAVESDKNLKVLVEKMDKNNVPKLFLACGKQDMLYKDNLKFVDILKEKGLGLTFYEEDGGHEWDFWDRNIKRVIDWLPLDADKNGINSGNVKIDK